MPRANRKEVQLDWLEAPAIDKRKKTGGARKGAGRKAWRGKTCVKRVPERYLPAIEALIAHLDNQRGKNRHQSLLMLYDLDDRLLQLDLRSRPSKSLQNKDRE